MACCWLLGIAQDKEANMKREIIFALLISIGSALFAQQGASAPQKFALVIGNARYIGISALNNPVNDANDMEAALKGLGFTVEKVLNGSLEQMENGVLNLKQRLGGSRNSYGFFFYAGHGVQSNGENFLIPVAADNIRTETQLRDRAVSLQFILDTMNEAGNVLNMVVLDACRDNPFGWARSGSRGLNVVSRAPTGSIVMYATGANSTASDGSGKNGLFTGHLLDSLKMPGLSVFEVFDRTMGNIISATNGVQHPELSLRYAGAASTYLGQRPSPSPAPQPAPGPSPAVIPPQPSPGPVPVSSDMVYISGGTFMMGSPANERGRFDNEGPQHQVTISSFYMGKTEVTQKEYQEIMGKNPSKYKGDNRPVEKVSWFDAIEYCNRSSQRERLTPAYAISGSGNNRTVTWDKNANGYRLPTEAEWEYACRAGTITAYNTGATFSANTGWYIENSDMGTHPTGQKPANAWGLYDMHGNVLEWCWDWWNADYASGSQTDPSGPASGTQRVARGGHWLSYPALTRSASRRADTPNSSYDYHGFRIARSAQ